MNTISDVVNNTDSAFAMNMIAHTTYERFYYVLPLIEKYQPEIVINYLGDPSRMTETVVELNGLITIV